MSRNMPTVKYTAHILTTKSAGEDCQAFVTMVDQTFRARGKQIEIVDLEKQPERIVEFAGVDAVPTLALMPNKEGHQRILKTGTCPRPVLEKWMDAALPG